MKLTPTSRKTANLSTKSGCRFAVAATLVVGSLTSLARAQDESSSADTAAARELAIEGIKLADAGHCAQAIDRLYRAEKLRHSPIVLGRLGECQIEEGKIVDGAEDLHRLLHEVLPANPPANVLRARERAQAVLEAAKPKIATLVISVRGPSENVTVTIDGQTVPALLLERDRPTDPGEHVIEATAPGYFKSSRRLSIGEGEKQEVTLKLRVDPDAAVSPVTSPPKPDENPSSVAGSPERSRLTSTAPSETTAAADAAPNHTASTLFWIVGGAAVATGGLFGYLALHDKQSLNNQCVNNLCSTSAKGTLDTANTYATASTGLVGAGAAGLLLATVLYFTAETGSTPEHPPTSITARPLVGISHIGLEGTF